MGVFLIREDVSDSIRILYFCLWQNGRPQIIGAFALVIGGGGGNRISGSLYNLSKFKCDFSGRTYRIVFG